MTGITPALIVAALLAAPAAASTELPADPNTDRQATIEQLVQQVRELLDRLGERTNSGAPQPIQTEQPTGEATQATPPATQAAGFDLTQWKLQLPTGPGGDTSPGCKIEEVSGDALKTYQSEWFKPAAGGGYVFKSPAKACTTSGSEHGRSELRRLNQDGSKEAWDANTGTHTMTIRQSIDVLPATQPRVVANQIHDADSDEWMLKADAKQGAGSGTVGLCYESKNAAQKGCIDTAYKLGTMFDMELTVTAGTLKVTYNGIEKVSMPFTTTGNYFKAGAYPMSATTDPASEYGQVTIESLTVTHSGDTTAATPADTAEPTTPQPSATATPQPATPTQAETGDTSSLMHGITQPTMGGNKSDGGAAS